MSPTEPGWIAVWCAVMLVSCCIRARSLLLNMNKWWTKHCSCLCVSLSPWATCRLNLQPNLCSSHSSCAWRTSGPSWRRAARCSAWRRVSSSRLSTCLTSGTLERWGDVCSVGQNSLRLADLDLSNIALCLLLSFVLKLDEVRTNYSWASEIFDVGFFIYLVATFGYTDIYCMIFHFLVSQNNVYAHQGKKNSVPIR